MYSDITGIILAGGKSKRMGINKALIKVGEKTIIKLILDLMESIFTKVIIISNTPDDYAFLNVPIFKDIYPGRGPMGGIHSGLTNSLTEKNFFISCDVPLMTGEMIKHIVEFKSDKPVKYCEAAGYQQPMVGFYSKSILKELETVIKNSGENLEKPFHIFLSKVNAEIIFPQKEFFYKEELFFNMNKPEDYKWLAAKFGE